MPDEAVVPQRFVTLADRGGGQPVKYLPVPAISSPNCGDMDGIAVSVGLASGVARLFRNAKTYQIERLLSQAGKMNPAAQSEVVRGFNSTAVALARGVEARRQWNPFCSNRPLA